MQTKLFMLFIFLGVVCHAAFAQKKVVIDKLRADSVGKFENGTPITAPDLEEGFEFHNNIPGGENIKVEVRNAKGKFVPLPKTATHVNNVVYLVKKESAADGFVIIQLTQTGKQPVLIKLNVQLAIAREEGKKPFVCDREIDNKIMEVRENCAKTDPNKPFGEDIKNYTQNTIVYVYDFDPATANGRMYKVWKNGSKLESEPANMSTETLTPRSDAWLKVINVNRYLYDIIIDNAAVDYESQPNSLFNALFIGDSTILGGLLKVFNTNLTKAEAFSEEEEKFNTLTEMIKCFLQTYNALQTKILRAYNPCTVFPCCEDETAIRYYDLANRLLDIRIEAGLLQNMVNEKKNALKKLSEEQAACTKAASDLDDVKKEKKKIEAIDADKRTAEQKKRLLELIDLEEKLSDKICTKERITELKTQIQQATEEVKNVSAIDDVLARLPSEVELRQMITFIANMTARNNGQFQRLDNSGNLVDLSIQVKTKDSIFKVLGYSSQNIPFHTQIPVVKKSFVSFSSGFYVGVPDYLKNKTYTWQKRPNLNNTILDTAKYVLTESGYSPPPMGFAALGNVEWKLTPNFGLGASVGVGITIEREPRPAYLIGGSAFFGNLRQFAITIGVAGMPIKKLNNNLQAIADQQITYATTSNVEYYKELRTGGFIAFTYTPFTTTKRK